MENIVYIFRLDWSQTDHQMIAVRAVNEQAAIVYAESIGARYTHFYGVANVHQT